MPFITDGSSASSSEADSQSGFQPQAQQVVSDAEYGATSFSGNAEKPLSEQLEPIAVCGMGCRLPGDVKSASEFWEMMINKGSGRTSKVPKSRFNIDAHFHQSNDRPGSFGVSGGYFLNETLQEFDPSFFNVTPIEAMWMDPQQRKLLEVVYESFESAGVTLDEISGSKTAAFVASFTADFQQMSFKEPSFRHSFAATGVDPGILSNRISHVFNLNGPSIYINTACSSSVYATHNACNALRNKECVAAVVAGVNLILTVDQHMNTAKLGVLSPTSTCNTFDASADGYGRAEAAGAVYLKRLSDAIRDGNPIRGLIRSSATNNNGRVPALGITHPNREGQVHVIKHAYQRGGDLDPRLTGYFETHGTGTPVGDPLEVHAVALAMNEHRKPDEDPLLIGAVKPNIGHSEAASGLSAVIKAILTVERGIIPPTRGVLNPNPAINWKDWKVTVPNHSMPFPKLPVKRVSVNSFGYGGTNAHIIVEGADSLLTRKQAYKHLAHGGKKNRKLPRGAFNRGRPFLLLFSAHNNATLRRNIEAYGTVASQCNLLDLTYTLGNRRTLFSSRGFAVAKSVSLKATFDKKLQPWNFADKKSIPTVGFVFTGQGAQWARMGAELMTYYPSFLRSIHMLDKVLGDLEDGPDWTLEDILLESDQTSPINEAEFSQPLCTAIQISLVQLLQIWGIKPAVTVGHSSGEIAAAYAAGLISASEAIVFAYYRGKVVRSINTNGAMMAVGLGAEDVKSYLAKTQDKVIVACHNSPAGVTLSGDALALEEIQKDLSRKNIFARIVKTNGKAYHSSHMIPAAAKYEAAIRRARTSLLFDLPLATDAKMVSTVTNSILPQSSEIDETYFSANLKQPVLFNQAVQTIAASTEFAEVDLLVEVGPHSAMAGPIRQIKSAFGFSKLDYLPSLLRGEDSAVQMLKLAGELFIRGYQIDIDRITALEESTESGKIFCKRGNFIVDLPPYQWGRKSYWAEARHSAEHRAPQYPRHDLLGSLIPGASLAEPTWRNILRIRDVPWLRDHSLGGEAVFPAAGYFSMAMEAITQMTESTADTPKIHGYILRDVSIKKALVTPDDDTGIEVLLNMRPSIHSESTDGKDWWDFHVSSIDSASTQKDHITGSISVNARSNRPALKGAPNLPQRASGKAWNQALREVGFDYGQTFADMDDIAFDGKTYACTSKSVVKTEAGNMDGESRHIIHPASVDSCLQLMIVCIHAGRANAMSSGFVPVQVDEISIWKPTEAQVADSLGNAFSWCDQRGLRNVVCSSQLTARDGEVLMEINNMRCTAYEAAVPQRHSDVAKRTPYGEMVWKLDLDSLCHSRESTRNLDIVQFIELAAFKNPAVKVIDVGGDNRAVLRKVHDLNYTATAAVSSLTEVLKTEVDGFKNANVRILDVSNDDLTTQGIKEGSFDIVVASRETKNLALLRGLLSSGGKAVLLDVPCADEIAALGFSGADIVRGSCFFAIGTVVEDTKAVAVSGTLREVQVIYRNQKPQIFQQVKSAFEALGYHVLPTKLEDLTKVNSSVIVLDFNESLLASLTEQEFLAVQNITNNATTLLWASNGGLINGKTPEAGIIAGLMRSVRSEQATINIVTMDFDLDSTPAHDAANLIATKGRLQIEKPMEVENEYFSADNQVYISRILPNDAVNDIYCVDEKDIHATPFDQTMRISGKIQSGKVVFQEAKEQTLFSDCVEVKVSYSGLTKEGNLVITGSDYPTVFSHEIAGTIERVGASVKNFAVGDRVVGFNFDKYSTYQRVPADLLQKVGAKEDLAKLVGLPMAYGAALHGLIDLANIQADEIVLILQGTGAAGVAAVEIAMAVGAIPYVAASGEAQAASIASTYGISSEQVLPSADAVFRFLRAGPREIDLVVSSGWTPSSIARDAWRLIAPFGRFIDCGRKNVLKRSALDTIPLRRGASYFSFDMIDLHRYKPKILAHVLATTLTMYRSGKITGLSPTMVKSITELDSAVSSFSDEFDSGKTIISYEAAEGQTVNLIHAAPVTKLRSDATYLLVGCLGGLGRSLTSWMMRKGAKNFAFLSRSGADGRQASILVENLEAAGANVQIVRGDAGIRKDVARAVASIPADRPIRGVIQAAMVLRDGLFCNMTYSSWESSINPKVRGTANLHAALSNVDLDFFLMTSSVSGILGTPGQASYAAANAYLDALARHRRAHNLKTCAAIIPMVLGVGIVAENLELEDALTRKGMYGIDEEQLLGSFEVAINEQGENLDHLVIGLDPSLLRKAIEDAGDDSNPFWMADPRFSTLVQNMKGSSDDSTAVASHSILAVAQAAAVSSHAEAVKVVENHLISKLSRMLLLGIDEFDDEGKSLATYGIDSMIGAELRNWIFKEFKLDVPFQQLLGPTLTISRFAEMVCETQGTIQTS